CLQRASSPRRHSRDSNVNSPDVRVPVLSKATTLTPASVSTAAPLGKEGLGERRKRSPRAPKRAPRAPGHTARPRREASSRGKTRSLVPLLAETKEDRKPTTRGKTSQIRERGSPRCMSSQIDL